MFEVMGSEWSFGLVWSYGLSKYDSEDFSGGIVIIIYHGTIYTHILGTESTDRQFNTIEIITQPRLN